ncbi:hypothetical protein [Qipengyuania nanhaisediminis]|uniref:hypothetical protein n=1 Tax=Qipengyuania nanhaisediminis TaxID=604088 RepID=UPI0038B3E435
MLETVAAAALAITQAAASQTPPAPPPTPPQSPACTGEGHAQFDFWVGEWEVTPNGGEQLIAHSRIERLYNGCAVRENWMPLNGRDGGSLNSYDAATGRWHQTWIGSSPGRVEFAGGWTGEAMVLTGNWPSPAAAHQLVRMTYTLTPEGHVRQHGEASLDHGASWQPSFDFIYRRKDTANP